MMNDPYVQYNSFSERNKTLLFQITTQFLFIQQFKMVVMTVQTKLTLWNPQNYGESLNSPIALHIIELSFLENAAEKKPASS